MQLSKIGVVLGFSCTLVGLTGNALGARPKSIEFGAGGTSYEMLRLTSSPSGKRNTLGTSFYHFHLQYHLPIGKRLVSPWLHYMPDSLSAVESTSKSSQTSLMALGLPLTTNLTGAFDLGTGPVLLQYTVKGTGDGAEVLNNGEGTATFYQPEKTVSATTFAWQVGSAWNWSSLRTGADVLIHAPLSSAKRSFSLMLTAAWVKS
ncbi:MAG: hypothetical protein EBU49_12615 [Proteobacteria bacterium]|nr:hypothetical protein [Pseudomonadota bacterium]